jgi:hypothetical protein
MIKEPNQITAQSAGWRLSAYAKASVDRQFRFAVYGLVPGVCGFYRSADPSHVFP